MAEKEETNGYSRSDGEAGSATSKELRHKKRLKCFLYIVAFAVFQIGIITLFAMTIMKFRTPKFRIRSVTFESLDVRSTTFTVIMNTELGVKNTNFGHFKYQNATIDFYHGDAKVGEVSVPRARAKARSTRKFNVTVTLTSTGITSSNSESLASDFRSGFLRLSSHCGLRGKVTIMKVIKKNRSANMNCTMEIVIQTRQVQNVMCK